MTPLSRSSFTFSLLPPTCPVPQVTTEPSNLIAAKAPYVDAISLTPDFSLSWISLLLPPEF